MSRDILISNTFKHLDRDTHPDAKNNETYEYALNATIDDYNQVGYISNESSNRLCHDYGETIVGSSYIEDRNATLVFLKNGELHLLSHEDCSSKFIASDTEFGCDWGFKECEWIYGEFKTMFPCDDLFVYWSSGCQYYWLNIDEMLDPVRKQALKDTIKEEKKQCSDRTCDYFRVFKCVATPKIVPISYDKGGQVPQGAYQFVGRLKDRDNNYSNWNNVTDPVYIGSENNVCGERSEGYIEINISSLDCKYDAIELAVIITSGGITSARRLAHLHYNAGSTSYTYYGTEGEPIDISELLIKKNTYIQGQDLMQKDGRLYLYNIKQIKNLDYQRRANEIETNWVEYEYTWEEAKRLGLKSHMRGETYAYGIKWNYCDGTSTPVFHIPASAGAGANSNASSGQSSNAGSSGNTFQVTQEGKYERTRSPIDDTVANPQGEVYQPIADLIKAWEVEMSDVCEALSTCEECSKGQEACNKEKARVEEVSGKYQDLLAKYGASEGLDEFPTTLTPTKIKEGAAKIIQAVENRERLKYQEQKIKVNNETSYEDTSGTDGDIFQAIADNGLDGLKPTKFGSQYYDANGVNLTGDNPKIKSYGNTRPELEKDLVYPDFKNCQGEYIYGSLAGTPIKHHKFPDTYEKPHYISKSTGVPSKITPEADPLSDAYVRLLGVRFDNIEFPSKEELSKPLDSDNPFTILYVKRTDSNKTIIAKGLATKTFLATNNDKYYAFPRHAVNSKERVDRNIDVNGSRLYGSDLDGGSFNFHSLDTNTRKLALNFTQVIPELEYYGEGFRYGLYAEGKKPDDQYYGTRIDQAGTRQFINLNKYVPASRNIIEPKYKTYARAHSVISPPKGGVIPLMNKYRESSVWIDGTLPALTKGLTSSSDNSFIGDVFDHAVPIEKAAAHYVTLKRDLPNQYGDLTGLVYIPLLQASKNQGSSIQGPVGDIFIGPYTFRRTGFVSDKVGNKFDIPGGQAAVGYEVTKKEERSVCDPPEDILLAELGTWVHTTLPKERDAADAKNYAGLHSPNRRIQKRELSIAAEGPETDYYFPKVVKTLIIYWGEFEVNPAYRAIGSRENGEVVYPDIRPLQLDSDVYQLKTHAWEESFINRFYCRLEQPSKWSVAKKVLIRTLINIIFPMLGIDNLFDIASGTEFVGNLVEFPMLYAMWYMLNKQVFTNDYLDKMVGIPQCKTDEEGSDCGCQITNFEDNYHAYCNDFSKINDTEVFYGMPEPYNTCDCDDCDSFTNNEIYYSNKQILTSETDSYKSFNANQLLTIPANSGKLKKLLVVKNQFIAHTTDNMYVLQYGKQTIPSSTGELLLGQAGLLSEPMPLFDGIVEGYAGLSDPNHSINTSLGYFWVDYDAKKVYRYAEGIEEISAAGMFNFFKDYIQFCNKKDCLQEKVPGSNYYSLGLDPRLNRFLITKSDGNSSFTLSYDLRRKNWISYHSYIPQFYIWDRDHMYTSNGNSIWIHDNNDSYQTYYGTYYPYILEFTSREPSSEIAGIKYKGTILNTEAREGDRLNLFKRETFNKVWLRNTHQTTGYINLEQRDQENQYDKLKERKGEIEVQWKANQWRFNELYDFTGDSNLPIVNYNDTCLPDVSPTNIQYFKALDKVSYENRILFDNYFTYRFIFDKFASLKLYTKNIITNAQKITE